MALLLLATIGLAMSAHSEENTKTILASKTLGKQTIQVVGELAEDGGIRSQLESQYEISIVVNDGIKPKVFRPKIIETLGTESVVATIDDSGAIKISGTHSGENAIIRNNGSVYVDSCKVEIKATIALVTQESKLKTLTNVEPHGHCGDYN